MKNFHCIFEHKNGMTADFERKDETHFFRRMKYGILFALLPPILTLFCSQRAGEANTMPQKPLPEYTLEKPREWSAWSQTHVPHMNRGGDDKYLVYLKPADPEDPGRFGPSHYIEKVGIMNREGRVLAVKEFDRNHRGPYSVKFSAPSGSPEELKLFARCNLHDLWSAPFAID